MNTIGKIILGTILLMFSISGKTQIDTSNGSVLIQQIKYRPKVAVFAPVYLDSLFDGNNYKLGNNNFPRTVLPGLDFYNGMMLAVDSLNAENKSLDILFYDTKNSKEPISKIVTTPEFQDVSLIIASFNSRAEMQVLADSALAKRVPIISATYPNDGGMINNPYFALVNPTLKTHIEALFKYLQREYPTDPIYLFKRKGLSENTIANSISEMNKKTLGSPLKIKIIELADTFDAKQVLIKLDSVKKNILVCGSLNEQFGTNLVKAVTSNLNFKATIIGMPTWDAIKDIGEDAEIIYSTPYNFTRTTKPALYIEKKYRSKLNGRPSDMAYKGFESLYRFGNLLIKHGADLIEHLSDKDYKLFNEFDFQPVKSFKEKFVPDYLENKKLYFIRKVDTQIKSVY